MDIKEADNLRTLIINLYKKNKKRSDYKEFLEIKKNHKRIEFSILPYNGQYPELGIYSYSKLTGKRFLNEHKLHKSRKFTTDHDYLMYYFNENNQLVYTADIYFDAKENTWKECFITKVIYLENKRLSYRVRKPNDFLSFDVILTLYDYEKHELLTYVKAWDELEIEVPINERKSVDYIYNKSIKSFRNYEYDI